MNKFESLTLEDFNAAMLSGKEYMLEDYVNKAIGIYCNVSHKVVGPRPAKASDYSGPYYEAYYTALNAIYEVWMKMTKEDATFDPEKGEFPGYFQSAVQSQIANILNSGGRTDMLSRPAKEKSKDDIYVKNARVDKDGGYWGDSRDPNTEDVDRDDKVRKFMSDELDALIHYIDGLDEKSRTVFLASNFGRSLELSPDKYGRNYAEVLAKKYKTTAGNIRKCANEQKDKALKAVQDQGFNKRGFTFQLIQVRPSFVGYYDNVIEATEKLSPFEQFLLLKHIANL